MKKIIFLFFLGLSFSNAQTCKFQYNEVDAFTKEKKTKTIKQTVGVTASSSLSFSLKSTDKLFLVLNYHTTGVTSIIIAKDSNLNLLLNNDEKIVLLSTDLSYSRISSLNNSDLESSYTISIEQIEKIKSVGLKKIRVITSKNYLEFDVNKKKWIDKLNNEIDCFLSEIQKQ